MYLVFSVRACVFELIISVFEREARVEYFVCWSNVYLSVGVVFERVCSSWLFRDDDRMCIWELVLCSSVCVRVDYFVMMIVCVFRMTIECIFFMMMIECVFERWCSNARTLRTSRSRRSWQDADIAKHPDEWVQKVRSPERTHSLCEVEETISRYACTEV